MPARLSLQNSYNSDDLLEHNLTFSSYKNEGFVSPDITSSGGGFKVSQSGYYNVTVDLELAINFLGSTQVNTLFLNIKRNGNLVNMFTYTIDKNDEVSYNYTIALNLQANDVVTASYSFSNTNGKVSITNTSYLQIV